MNLLTKTPLTVRSPAPSPDLRLFADHVYFTGATFSAEHINFSGATFSSGTVVFDGATFSGTSFDWGPVPVPAGA
ncbi:hypothetical protein [Streptomyces sp. AcE210]|uniref:hypothetical protein n=1 Tax=Streptomyces sp. AcE210 TaxID=2292703 RepID=UPI000E30A604|nr:hypothetical protein [Streptomyces sp. AcE210]RFC78256.1 hypothetical protein DXZ75_11215 [Streptomyces sp. AcE210]